MIDFYTWSTSNGRKVAIGLEEMGLAYRVHPIDIYANAQFDPAFAAISANAKIPAIVDHDAGVTMFESGAILIHLAEKTGQFLPASGPRRAEVLQWLMWQMGGFGPILGQTAHFLHYSPGKSAYAAERFGTEARRLYGVLDRRLAAAEFVAGDYSIADMAIWPWSTRFEHQKIDLREFAHVARWYAAVARRPAVQRGYRVPDASLTPPTPSAQGAAA
ncbi:glutathione S-transferase N-terminal domain-containing protein [uncultured Tateyamaria sp.]|uniref:glutathione S-transferase N-terminal domain-containing protein n=1 Tax=uncultured Tateyamaria sp. TaxID=455651 RepID=UPI00260BD1B0|nr:glutathione S-transferase N-terminal domain-containing protein [uncultured Tateyamaria sp.]